MLASSAVLGLVVGFAARQTLANAVAGILLAITQPIRIGDLVTFEGETGEVEDVQLTYTYIRLDDGRRLIVPNERLAQSIDREPHDRRPARAGRGVGLAPARRRRGPRDRAARGGRGWRRPSVAEIDKDGRAPQRQHLGAHGPRERGPSAAADSGADWLATDSVSRSILSQRPPEPLRGAPPSPMTHRQRQSRRRRRHGGGRSKLLLALGVLAIDRAPSASLSLAGYVLAIAATAPDLDELKPIDKGAELGGLRRRRLAGSATCSRTSCARRSRGRDMPVDLRSATVAIEDERFYEHERRRLRGRSSARASRTSSPARPCRAARRSPSSWCARSTSRTRKRDFKRKIREAKLASELEEEHSKTLDPRAAT